MDKNVDQCSALECTLAPPPLTLLTKSKTKTCIDKLTFTFYLLVGLMHNSTTAKILKKNGPVNAFLKTVKNSFITSGIIFFYKR